VAQPERVARQRIKATRCPLIRHLKSGVLDYVPADLPDRVAPKLVEHYERIKNDPRVKAYYAKHGVTG
jgi:glutathione S-transferase